MKKIIVAAALLFFSINILYAQCKPIDLNALQAIQNLSPEKRETKVLDMGFELKPGQGPAATTKSYGKCNEMSGGKHDFYQTITLNSETNSIIFVTYAKKNYISMRKAIEDSPNYKFSHKLTDGSDQFESKSYKISFLVNEKNYSITLANLN